jgi:hypothetical protein
MEALLFYLLRGFDIKRGPTPPQHSNTIISTTTNQQTHLVILILQSSIFSLQYQNEAHHPSPPPPGLRRTSSTTNRPNPQPPLQRNGHPLRLPNPLRPNERRRPKVLPRRQNSLLLPNNGAELSTRKPNCLRARWRRIGKHPAPTHPTLPLQFKFTNYMFMY